MSVKALEAKIQDLVKEEYERAATQYGPAHASQHEAYAVMREEFQEAVEELNEVGRLIEEDYWMNVRKNRAVMNMTIAESIIKRAVLCACECVQTAAMAYKAMQSKEDSDAE